MQQSLYDDKVFTDKLFIINQMGRSGLIMKAERTIGLNTKLRIQLLPFGTGTGTNMVGIKEIKYYNNLSSKARISVFYVFFIFFSAVL